MAALPSVDYPTISVTASVPGANPETMASSVATPLEREFSTIAGIQSMNSQNSLGTTTITVQFALDRKIDAAAQDIQAAIARAGGRLPTSMPRPPSYQKVNPAEQPVLYLALDSETLPMYTVNEYADTLLAQRISMVGGRLARAGLRRAEIRRARAGGSRPAGRARHRHRRSAARHRLQQHQPAHRASWMATRQSFTIESIGTLAQRRRLPAHHRGLAQRLAGAAGAVGPRGGQRGQHQAGGLVSTTAAR